MIKRICVISFHTCPLSDEKNTETGGMNTYVLELSKALCQKGLKLDIYTRCVDKDKCNIVQVLPNLRVIHLQAGEPTLVPRNKLLELVPDFTSKLMAFIKKGSLSYDLISSHYWLSGLVGLEIKKKFKIPLYLTFHTLALMKNLVARNELEKEDLERVKTELKLVKEADKIIATSKSDLEYIHTLYNCPLGKITLLSPGVDLNVFKPIDKASAKQFVKADQKHKIILFVGRITPLKGLDLLLYAIKILVQRNPKLTFCLWIVGGVNTGNKDKWSEELIRLNELKMLLGIHAYVRFVGRKNREELPYYYNAAEAVVMPSYYESFGLAALEAMACGIPVIITDVAGISNLLGKKHSPLLTSASNPILLASKIKNLLTNREEHKLMSREVFNKVQNLSWQNTAENFIKNLL